MSVLRSPWGVYTPRGASADCRESRFHGADDRSRPGCPPKSCIVRVICVPGNRFEPGVAPSWNSEAAGHSPFNQGFQARNQTDFSCTSVNTAGCPYNRLWVTWFAYLAAAGIRMCTNTHRHSLRSLRRSIGWMHIASGAWIQPAASMLPRSMQGAIMPRPGQAGAIHPGSGPRRTLPHPGHCIVQPAYR